MKNIQESDGYKKLLGAVEKDEQQSPNFHNYRAKLQFVLDRAEHYAQKTGLEAADIIDAWEKDRTYWYMNYYQASNQPTLDSENVRVFETVEALRDSVGKTGFRCPSCAGVSKSPYICDSGKEMFDLGKSTTAATLAARTLNIIRAAQQNTHSAQQNDVAAQHSAARQLAQDRYQEAVNDFVAHAKAEALAKDKKKRERLKAIFLLLMEVRDMP